MKKLIDFLASYALCCVLLLCLFCLTLFGTLYQVDHGLYEAKAVYFHSWFLHAKSGWVLPFPYFPGGMSCMLLLSVNMLLGGLVRMKINRRTIGVAIIHVGIAFMLIAGLVKMMLAEEGNLKLVEGQRSNYFQSYHDWEVAISEFDQGEHPREVVITHQYIADLEGPQSRRFHFSELPFELELSNFVENCRVERKGPMWQSTGPPIDGYGILKMPNDKESEFNVAGMHARVGDQQGILWGMESEPWTVTYDGKKYGISLRHETYAMPFEIELVDFIKEDHPGMTMAKAFRSQVLKIDDSGEKPVLIQMNEPLREGNLVLFQSSYGQTRSGREYSVFSVVRNLSDKWPEYSLWVITFGMLLTFLRKLLAFIKAQGKRRAKTPGAA